MGEMHAKKICNIYSMAMKMGAPVIGLVDCAGLRLQEATDALDGFGKLYLSQTMASGVIPQIMAIFGTCGGGMAVSAGMADFTFMEDTSAKLFVNSPNAWRAITRQNVILLPRHFRASIPAGGRDRYRGRDLIPDPGADPDASLQ